ncbi:MAG: hypothetical protein SFW67_35685 [Myxococcaceae bacterium]|nr:hypothetical protein [Myxococcaceae bacterium]
MDVYLSSGRVRLGDADLVGEGGEARVFRHQGRAVKVFHPVSPQDAVGRAVRAKKLEKLSRFPTGLPPTVLGPQELARSARGDVLGFVMRLVQGDDAGRLAQRRFRDGRVSNDAVTGVFARLSQTLAVLHGRGVVVGDLNDGNVLVSGDEGPFLIDADSMQFDGLPCAVGHERFLDPRLYGVDLSTVPRFDPGTDWFAFAVMLFSSWLYVHPFGGTHAKLGTLLRRAEARHSVLRDDVVLPRVAASWKTLPDEALHWFRGVFEADVRSPAPDVLWRTAFTTCRCGLEHARPACPACHALGPLATRPAVRVKGRCTARVLRQTTGRMVTAAMQGGVRFVIEEDGVLRREDGSLVLERRLDAGERLAIAGASTWLSDARGGLVRLENGRVVERAQTGLAPHGPILAAATQAVYRTEHEWLIDQVTGARVGQVLEGQTWLWTGERLGLGFYRAGGVTVAFLFKTGRAGLKQLPGVGWSGRLVSAHAAFDARHALLTVTTETSGRDVVHRWLLSETGEVLAAGHDGRAGHGALLQGRVVIGTDAGLVSLGVSSGVLVEGTCFTDTQPFVSAQDELLPQSDGSLVVVGARDVLQLSLS